MTTTTISSFGRNISDDEYEYEYYADYLPMTPAFQAFSGTCIGILTFVAIVGNITTVWAFIVDRKLRTVYDFYIFNLAITDLLIGCISMPFYAVYTLKEFTWDFGVAFCKIWLAIDFTLCLESVLLMLLLSYDRLLLVTLGPKYAVKCTWKRAYLNIVVSWVLAFLLYGPAIISWDFIVGYSTLEEMDCDVEFAQHFEFTTVTAVIEFVIPVSLLTLLNALIYRKIRKRLRGIKRSPNSKANISTIPTAVSHINGETSCVDGIKQDNDTHHVHRETRIKFETPSNVDTLEVPKSTTRIPNRNRKRDTNLRAQRDSKAARFLIILVLVFLVSWAPYTITTIIVSFCEECVNTSVYEAMNWILWGKSAVNPFIYALNSSRYRYNFRRFMCWWWTRKQVHPENVEVTCHSNVT